MAETKAKFDSGEAHRASTPGEDELHGQGKLFHIGELAKAVGKTVRALHLYEELGLLTPVRRTKGGFRLYDAAAADRVAWIANLQGIGFTLAQIQGFVREFEDAPSGRDATRRVREIFEQKLGGVREQMAALAASERDLEEALAYLDACTGCSPSYAPAECRACDHHGHEPEKVPHLFAGLSETAGLSDLAANDDQDVALVRIEAQRGDGGSHGVQ